MLVHEVPGGGFQNLDEADVQVVLKAHAAELVEGDLEQLTAIIEPEDEEDVMVLWRGLR
jgi:hypothetical protein